MNRIFKYRIFGNTGLQDKPGRLKAYSALWNEGMVHISITVWARNRICAYSHCREHGLTYVGEIVERK